MKQKWDDEIVTSQQIVLFKEKLATVNRKHEVLVYIFLNPLCPSECSGQQQVSASGHIAWLTTDVKYFNYTVTR